MRIKRHRHRKITMTYTCPNNIVLLAGKKRGPSCWGWSPGPRVRKIRKEIKLLKNLLKCKSTIQIAIFKVRTLNKIGQLPELTASAIDDYIDIICIQEHRYIHSKISNTTISVMDERLSLHLHGKNSVKSTIRGLGMLIEPRAQKSLNRIKKIQTRMMVAMFNGNPSATIIFCYSLTNVNEETDLVNFYNELSSFVRNIPKHNVIGEDMNA